MEEPIVLVPKKRGRPRKVAEATGKPGGVLPTDPVEFCMDSAKKRAKQNTWMHQYLTPGNYVLITRDHQDGSKRGKLAFLVPAVRSNMHPGKRVPALCLCDVIVDKSGEIVRKPNYRAAQAGTSKKGSGPDRKTYMYEQLFVTLDLVHEVVAAMLKLAGSEPAQEAAVEAKVVAAVEQKSEDEKWMDENIGRALGGLL